MNLRRLLIIFVLLGVFVAPVSAFKITSGDQIVNISSYIQTRYAFGLSQTDQFTVPRLRSDIWGDVNENIGYLVELDAVASPALIYGWIDLKPNKAAKFRVGRFYYPFGLEYTTPPSRFDTINPTITLWSLFGYSRDNGVQWSQEFDNFKYALALMNGADNQTIDDNESKDLFGRFVLKKSADFNVGFSFQAGKSGSTEADRQRIGAELDYKLDTFGFKAEYIRATDDGVKKWGWYVQPSLWINPSLQGLIRYEYWDPSTQTAGDLQRVTTLGINVFIDPNTKLQINYELKSEEAGISNDALLIQLQVMI